MHELLFLVFDAKISQHISGSKHQSLKGFINFVIIAIISIFWFCLWHNDYGYKQVH